MGSIRESEVTFEAADVDADGAVWTAHTHSATHTKNADGRWKKAKRAAFVQPPIAQLSEIPAITVLEQLQEGPAPVATITIESIVEELTKQFETKQTTYEAFNAALKSIGLKTIYEATAEQLQSIATTFGIK